MSPVGATDGARDLLLQRSDTGTAVPARVLRNLGSAEIAAADAAWRSFQSDALRRQEESTGETPEHLHWQWTRKADRYLGLLAYEFLGIHCDSGLQGMGLIRTVGSFGRLPGQRRLPLVYVDYLSAAPWNVRGIVPTPRFRGVGSALIREAVAVSYENEYRGRIGLHSLPQAEGFYREVCGMSDLGPDDDAYGLRYFEMTSAGAETLLRAAEG